VGRMMPVMCSRRAEAAGAPAPTLCRDPAGPLLLPAVAPGLEGWLCASGRGCCSAAGGCLEAGACFASAESDGFAGLLTLSCCALEPLAFLGAVSGTAASKLKRLHGERQSTGGYRKRIRTPKLARGLREGSDISPAVLQANQCAAVWRCGGPTRCLNKSKAQHLLTGCNAAT
jgi:hypothetical protein